MNQPDMVLQLLKAIAGHRHHPPPEPTRCAPTTEAAYQRVISQRHATGGG